MLTGRLDRSLPPDVYLDLAAPPSRVELERLPGYLLPARLEPESTDTRDQNDYVDLWVRKTPFPPRWQPR